MSPARTAPSFLLSGATFVILALLAVSCSRILDNSSDSINRQLDTIESELDTLPNPTPASAPATMGCRSRPLDSPDESVAIEVLFPEPAAVDHLVLMPAPYTEDGYRLSAFGFPQRFLIERILPDGSLNTISDYRETDYHIPGIEPQHFPCPDSSPAIGIRITATRAPYCEGTGHYLIALGELYAFAGSKNVALNSEVTGTNIKWLRDMWSAYALVDGFSLFSPVDRRHPDSARPFRVFHSEISLTYDTGKLHTIDGFRLWPALVASDYTSPSLGTAGFPSEIILQKLEHPDDPAPVEVFRNSHRNALALGANPLMLRTTPTTGRYFRFVFRNGLPNIRPPRQSTISLSEIELIGNNQPLNRDIVPTASPRKRDIKVWGSIETLNNGLASEGKILPLRQWLEQFSRRRQLERRQSHLEKKLDLALLREKERARILIAAAAALILILLLILWVARLLGLRRWAGMREQIASDLHDEVGANLSSIVHSSELLSELTPEADSMQKSLLTDTINVASRTSQDIRQFIQFLEKRESGPKVDGHIRKIATQILGPIEHTITLGETRAFNQLVPIRQWDFFFFLKECLNNIIKHSGATHVSITTRREGNKAILTVEDNGCGIPPDRLPLHHLERRAKQLKGTLDVETEPKTGSKISLSLTKWKKQ